MPFGSSVTNFIGDLFPTDPLAPHAVADFARALPPSPIRGAAVSDFARNHFPTDPVHPADLGASLSDYIKLLHQVGSDGGGLGDSLIF